MTLNFIPPIEPPEDAPPPPPEPPLPPEPSLGVFKTFNSSNPCNCCFNFLALSAALPVPDARSSAPVAAFSKSSASEPRWISNFHPNIAPKALTMFSEKLITASKPLLSA